MLISTTSNVLPDAQITRHIGVVSGQTVFGINLFRDIFTVVRDVFGGRSDSYEAALREARQTALMELKSNAQSVGAGAIIGVTVDVESVASGRMLLVSAMGTAVEISPMNT